MEAVASKGRVLMLRDRRSDHDITNTVLVTDWKPVWEVVDRSFTRLYPGLPLRILHQAFEDFDKLFRGRMPGYFGCDTVYHDIQHTLDMTLALARLIEGHEVSVSAAERLGAPRAILGIICSLFHDAGYIRHTLDERRYNGAEFTRSHVTRSAQFLARYLNDIGLGAASGVARQVVHYTGYEVRLDQIQVVSDKDRKLGHLMGTADLLAQMSDRCYLEKCRDRLYPEFVLGGIAAWREPSGRVVTRYRSGLDLLRQTPAFFRQVCEPRLERSFGGAYRYLDAVFDGRNPYMVSIERNLFYLERVLEGERWPLLRRHPTCELADPSSLEDVRRLVAERLRELRFEAA
ncbi:MAG: hypothetical protein ACNA8J_00720 [Gammaproteobacteria bacterium]